VRVPGDDADELDWLLFDQSGVLTTKQALRLLSLSKVRHLVATDRWRRWCRGVLVTHTGTLTHEQQLWVAVLSVGGGAVVAGVAAAVEGGLRGFRAAPIDLLVPPDRTSTLARRHIKPGMPGTRVHRTGVLPDEHVQVGRPMRTTTARSVVDAAQWARSDDEARSIIAAGCQQGRVTPEEILAVVELMPRARRRALVIETARYVEGGAEALSEIDFVRLCRRHGLPPPDLQERRQDASGRVRYLDAYWRDFHLQVEVDGAHHMDVRHWEADMRRQNDLWIKGDRILRFSAWSARHHSVEIAGQLRRALEAAGWHLNP
jgi:very-short-patch-repair endonuclease